MSFIIGMYVREGIVLASDSRITLNTSRVENDKTIINLAVGQSDSVNKTFLTPNNIGISTCGDADIKGVPIAGYIESFISNELIISDSPSEVADKLLNHFSDFDPIPSTIFFVAGYDNENQEIWQVTINENKVNMISLPNDQGAVWHGEGDIVSRLLLDLYSQKEQQFTPIDNYPINFNFFTLQDAIDFSVYAVRTTIETIRFQTRSKTVGGPIDVLVIKPNKAFWIQHKTLHIK